MGHCGQQLILLVRSSVAPSTWQSYGKSWVEWCQLINGRPVHSCCQARLEVTVEFLLLLWNSEISGSSAQQRLSGLAFYFQLLDWPDVTKAFIIRQALKGWKRAQPCKESRRPISFSLLHQLVSSTPVICSLQFEAALFSAAYVILYFGALRISELVPKSKNMPDKGLLSEDVVVVENAIRLRICRSKTDPSGRGAWILVSTVSGCPVCPVTTVLKYLEFRINGKFFLAHADGSPLTKFQFQSVYLKGLQASGVLPGEYGTHSFRIGVATEAAKAGLPEAEVQRIGRWRSACYARYIRPDLLI
ncbi:uncharacterized protein [Ranitomeya imitator]|uniref:uncharacterized protein n=1 Tax=Ranitomeya imitator TaxID=111125 RepID=UPI0037E8CE33